MITAESSMPRIATFAVAAGAALIAVINIIYVLLAPGTVSFDDGSTAPLPEAIDHKALLQAAMATMVALIAAFWSRRLGLPRGRGQVWTAAGLTILAAALISVMVALLTYPV